MTKKELKPLKVGELIKLLKEFPEDADVLQYGDEEGNSLSAVCLGGIQVELYEDSVPSVEDEAEWKVEDRMRAIKSVIFVPILTEYM